MEQDNYTCPYCRWGKSHSWSGIRADEEVLKSEYVGMDAANTYYLDTKRKYMVKICPRCERSLKVRSTVLWTLMGCGMALVAVALVCIVLEMFAEWPAVDTVGKWTGTIGMGFAALTALFWALWKVAGPSRPHVKYDKAEKCNALAPINYSDAIG